MNCHSCTRFSQDSKYHTCSKRILGPCYLEKYSIVSLNGLWLSNVSTMSWRSPERYLCSAIVGWWWGSCCLRWWNWDNDSSSWSIPLVCISYVALLRMNFDSERECRYPAYGRLMQGTFTTIDNVEKMRSCKWGWWRKEFLRRTSHIFLWM
jgi:hypothetical protein